MTLTLASELIALGALFFCSAFFSSAETALFSLNPIHIHRIKKLKSDKGARIEKMMSLPSHLLSTILIGNTLVNVAASALGYVIVERLLPGRAEVVSILSMTGLLLIFGEVAPKRLAMSRAERLATAYVPVLEGLIVILAPLRIVLDRVAAVFEKYLRKTSRTLTEDEFLTVVEVGEEEGVLDEEERTMVDGIIGLEETQASDVMTPRVDLVGIDLDDPPTDSRALAASVTYRYLPVYRGSLDHPEGLLDVRQYLLSSAPDLTEAMIPAVFVPETAPLDTLLKQFQEENKRAALVADEYGGTAGLITRGDILEEIVADVENEYGETAHIPIQQLAADRWLVDGNTSLEDINDEIETELEADGADRIAGWVAAQAEHIPRSGEVVEAQSCRATVQRVRRNRVTQVLLEKLGRSKRFNGERTIS